MVAEDAELLRRYVRDRAEEAFAELVRRYLSLVYHAALRQVGGDAHTAEDVTQQVFTLLARKASSLSGHQTLAGWLHTTTRFAANQAMRTERRRRTREQEAHRMNEISLNDPMASGDWERLRPVIDETLGELNERDREAVLLRFFAGLPLADVGEKLNLTENAARMRVARAIEKLRDLLVRRGVTSTSEALGLMLAGEAAHAAPAGLAASVTGTAMASAVASPAIGLLQFMTTTKMATGVAGVALMILTIGTAIHEHQARSAAEASLAAASSDQQVLVSKLTGLEKSVRVAEQDAAEMKQRIDAARAAAAAKIAVDAQAAKEKATWDPATAGKEFLKRHPEVRQALVESQNASVNFRYGRLYQPLGLTSAQIEQFQALLREGSATSVSLGSGVGKMAVLSTGTGMSPDEMNSGLRELLGEDRFKRFLEFARSEPARRITQEVAQALCFTDSPLTAEQAGQLTEVISSSPLTRAQGWTPSNPFDWAAVTTKAQGVLSAPQIAVVDGLRAQATWQAMNRQIKQPSK